MTVRKRRIVGLGEVIFRDVAAGAEPGGLGARVALAAVGMGHEGIVISRLGQDEPARIVRERLAAAGVDVSHLQSDPDLPTARMRVRGGREITDLEGRYAFDNLQFDFDLEDVAQVTDAAFYGLLTRRSGQARGEEHRFLQACSGAFRLFDLTARRGDDVSRGHAQSGFVTAEGVVLDDEALEAVLPGPDRSRRERIVSLMREHRLECVIDVGAAATTLTVHTPEGASEPVTVSEPSALLPSIVALVALALDGASWERALTTACRAGEHLALHPRAPVPDDLRRVDDDS